MTINSCPICKGNISVYSRCFDCKNAIQWICYKCQWESNLRDHIDCHKTVSSSISMTKIQKPEIPVFSTLKNRVDEFYHTPLQMIAPVFNLVH